MTPHSPKGHTGHRCVRAEDRAWMVRVRQLNDDLRTNGRGGMFVISEGLAAHWVETVNIALATIGSFDEFTSNNDPWGERDGATLNVRGIDVRWTITSYDKSRTMHSPNPADPHVTTRVMTIMLAGECCCRHR